MPVELAYAILTPYSLYKSRTGGILARLIARTGLDLVSARMFAPSRELVGEYASMVISARDPQDRQIQNLIRDYVQTHFTPNPKTGRRQRVMMLLFRGEKAVSKIRNVVGNFSIDRTGGETIRALPTNSTSSKPAVLETNSTSPSRHTSMCAPFLSAVTPMMKS